MIDALLALLGRKQGKLACGWCCYKDENWFDRTFGGYAGDGRTAFHRLGWWVYNDLSYKARVWKIGQYWHHKHHARDYDTWRDS